MKRTIAAVAPLMCVAFAAPAQSQQVTTLNGAVQFNDDHTFTKALVKFEELLALWFDTSLLDRSNKGLRPRADKSLSTREEYR